MKIRILILIFLLSLNFAYSQEKAITQSGKSVILYEDGTWEYERKFDENKNTSNSDLDISKNEQISIVNPEKEQNLVTKSIKKQFFYNPGFSENKIFLQGTSKRLDRFFRDPLNQMECVVRFESKDNQILLHFHWRFMNPEISRYLGHVKLQNPLILNLLNNTEIYLFTDEDFQAKENEMYDVSSFNYSIKLDETQIENLIDSPIKKVEMTWSKRNEDYEIMDNLLFQKELAKLIKIETFPKN